MSDLIDDPREGENVHEFTVSEISGAVKRSLEAEFGRIRVKGEVGRVVLARSATCILMSRMIEIHWPVQLGKARFKNSQYYQKRD